MKTSDIITILAIDDITDNLTTLSAVVRDALPQTRVLTATNGPDGIALAAAEDPDVILLDIVMPGMDGFAVCRRLKADEPLKDIPVVFLTALKTDAPSRVKALETGAEGFLAKPLEPVELTAQIRAMAKVKQANRRQQTEKAQLEAWVAERTQALQQANEQLQKNYRKTRRILEDLKAEVQAREAREAELQKVTLAVEQAGETIVITDPDGTIEYVNPAFEKVTGYSRTDVLGRNLRILNSGEQDEAFYQQLWKKITSGRIWQGRMVNKRKDGRKFTEEATISPVHDGAGNIINYVAVKRDITGQLELAAQFQQAQKMESVGRLAGGVAHDFNNMLSVILGTAQLAMMKMDRSDQRYADFEQIEHAAQRASDITSKLLAFARKQTVAPKVLDLNTAVESMLKMLRRLLREDITLSWHPGAGVWQVCIDPSQMDQILVNLCVNARDAIQGTGEIHIETGNVVLDSTYSAEHKGLAPGEYVMVAVSDTGCGMDKNTLDLIYEPFFTTKKVGQGTGLGLPMVYGIMKQNKGYINVYSEPGQGTTFKLYFPRDTTGLDGETGPEELKPETGRGETLLVVEDEPALLAMATQLLERLNYKVLGATRPDEALDLAEKHAGKICLLLTDVVMPEMNGRELADRLSALYPDMKRVFMSGYTADVIAGQGVLDNGMHFIQKPLTIQALAATLRQALDSK